MKSPSDLGTLLENASWLRGLARALADARADADDLVQDTWLAALRSPPDRDRPARPWLGQVLRNVRRMAGRAAERRRAREAAAGEPGGAAASAEELIERMELQRRIADLVMALEEPYRTAVLLRYYEGRLAKEIARSLGLPAGTVRWQITAGLQRLRARLQDEAGGDRTRVRARLLAVAGRAPGSRGGGAGGDRPLSRIGRSPLAAVGLTVTAAVGALVAVSAWRSAGRGPAGEAAVTSPAAPSARGDRFTPTGAGRPGATHQTKEEEMRIKMKYAAALVGTVLPALIAGAQTGRELTRDEQVDFCVRRWERMAVCQEEFAAYFSSKAPPERRAAARARFLAAAREAGTGPLEPRRQKCGEAIDSGRVSVTPGAAAEVTACLARPTCQEVVACMRPGLDNAPAKKVPATP